MKNYNNLFLGDQICTKEMLDDISEMVYLVDRKFKIVYINKSAYKHIFNNDDIVGVSIFKVFPSLSNENSNIIKVFKTGIPIRKLITNYIDNNGNPRVSLASIIPVIQNGIVVNVYEISEDYTGISNLSKQLIIQKEKKVKALNYNIKVISTKKREGYYTLEDIIGRSDSIKNLKEQIRMFAESPSNLLIYGETGTGKEMVVESIFSLNSQYKSIPFIVQNCAAIPDNLLESILFGTVKGAFTGAESRPGLFELVSGGILYLDEINSILLSLQPKILRVLEEGRVRRVGAKKEIKVDFRLISSSNVDPEVLLSSCKMRKDLFYRLNVLNINVLPLRERKEDIPLFIDYYIREFNKILDKKIEGCEKNALEALMAHSWPGNVRELRNVIERCMYIAKRNFIRLEDIKLFPLVRSKKKWVSTGGIIENEPNKRIKLNKMLSDLELKLIMAALDKFSGNISKASRELDIPQQTLNSKINKYDLKKYIKKLKLPENE